VRHSLCRLEAAFSVLIASAKLARIVMSTWKMLASRPRVTLPPLFLRLFFLPMCFAAACFDNNECEPGSPNRCDGIAIVSCEGPCSDIGCAARLHRQPCDRVCVLLDGDFPACVESTTQDPKCNGVTGYCDQQELVECVDGYVRDRTSCPADGACIEPAGQAPFCALSPLRDPNCESSASMSGPTCSGKDIVRCNDGFVTYRQSCAQACASPFPAHTFCAGSAEADPMCNMASGSEPQRCVGDSVVYCELGFARESVSCASMGQRCVTNADGAVCEATVVDAGTLDRDQ
jgi:hypothetical protein